MQRIHLCETVLIEQSSTSGSLVLVTLVLLLYCYPFVVGSPKKKKMHRKIIFVGVILLNAHFATRVHLA